MKKIYLLVLACLFINIITAQKVKISGNKFTLNDKEIWFNGINTPWHLFGDFGRQDFVPEWWTEEFAKYKENNINLARVWVHMSGEFSPNIDATGKVTGTNDIFWDHMDHLMDVSEQNGVYLMPALFSFDITKDGYKTTAEWRKWIQSEANIQSYIDNVLIPLLKRYDNRPYLLAWEICNEPEWMFENTEHGPQSFTDVQKMHAMLAAAIHENSSKFVTTGSAAPKWNAPIYDDWGDNEGNMFSDEALSSCINNPEAYLDFYQFHWYPWQSEWMKSPFTMTTVEYGVDDKPVIVGESEGNDVCDKFICQTVSEMYESAFNNGFDGVCAWKTPQNDGHGTFENISKATNSFFSKYPNLIYPEGYEDVPVTGISLNIASVTIEEGKKEELEAILVPNNASDKRVEWSSSDATVATVDNGIITAVSVGECTVSVSSSDGNFSSNCIVTVTERDPTNSTNIELTYKHDGAGEFFWVTNENINYANSWNLDKLEINGVDYTNKWSNSMPDKINGTYEIYYVAQFNWSHVEIVGASKNASVSKSASVSNEDKGLLDNTIKLYPNPASSEVTVSGLSGIKIIKLLSISGETLLEQSMNGKSSLIISLDDYCNGVYFISFVSVDGKLTTKKLLIK
ncbi:Ig-like domain-containing protein [Saccharicrinis fermentans]|nr:Ig-like domain-containing protein [Saccharicrinis fermentans]